MSSKKTGLTESHGKSSSRVKSWTKGLLAHLIIVPAWVLPPGLLLGSLLLAGAPFGVAGLLANLGVAAVLLAGPKSARPALCAFVLCMAYRAGDRIAMTSAIFASFLTWLVTRSGKIARRPWLFNYVSTWAKDFYAETALRGALDDIRPSKSFFGFHPHGCLSAGFTINGTFNPDFMKAATRVAWLCDNTLRHKNPGFRLMAEAYEAEDKAIEACDAPGFKQQMSNGVNVSFIPGGFLDAVAFEFGKDVCVLRNRKGFIKYCLRYGYRAHPVYTFGECETYYTFRRMKALRMTIAKNNVPAVAFFGWSLLPFLPRPQSRLLTYVGKGIDLPQIPEPSNEDVDHWHKVYMEGLQKLFDENKAEAGYPDRQLKIL
mmetsp:Transcript_135742/g.192026  ORF Transcript_135742/g.192026 Transcript_135742/m.192026 type:complete len:373 (+) Transcript_135742:42-1160(+)